MADSNHVRRDGHMDFSDNDPFAELARIMGHDPRAQQPVTEDDTATSAAPDFSGSADASADSDAPVISSVPAALTGGPDENDLGLDLERELAAGLDFSGLEQPVAEDEPARQDDWRMQPEIDESEAPLADDQTTLSAELDDFFMEEFAPVEGQQSSIATPTAQAELLDQMGEGLDEALERELFGEETGWMDPDPIVDHQEPAYEAPDYKVPDYGASDHQAAEDHQAPDHEVSLDQHTLENQPVYEAVERAQAPAVSVGEPDAGLEDHDTAGLSAMSDLLVQGDALAAGDDWTSAAEFDIDFLERELAASMPQAQQAAEVELQPEPEPEPEAQRADAPTATFEAEPFFDPQDGQPEEASARPADEPAERVLTLEEELQLLLADDPKPAARQSDTPHRTDAGSFSRANFAASQPAVVAASASAGLPEAKAQAEADFSAEPEVETGFLEAAETDVDAAALTSGALGAPTSYFATRSEQAGGADLEPVATVEAAAQEARPEDDLDQLFSEDDFTFAFAGETGAHQAETVASEVPEIETVEVIEAVPPVRDDLDIPDIEYDAPAAAPDFHDDFHNEFVDLFGDTAPAGSAVAPTAAVLAGAAGESAEARLPEMSDQTDAVFDGAEWQESQDFDEPGLVEQGFNYKTDLEQAIAMSADDSEAGQSTSRGRVLIAAAVLGGVVLLGGGAVLGISMFGGDSDAPAIVRSDPGPIKVRPENPGGTTVPNQDNEVYQRVSGAGSDTAPSQEQLITSAEEPVDVLARTVIPQEATPALAPFVDDETEATSPIKSEERIEQTPEAVSPVEAQETIAVAPRRVRTMIVRPDGTMVPREEPAPEPVAGMEQPAAPVEATELSPPGQPVQQVDEIDGGPAIEMPQTVTVVPTQRNAAQQSAPAAPAAPQAAVQQQAAPTAIAAAPAAAPAGAASAATSEWSMQIASQPTAEGAQSSYQDLARRYGSVLEGRGVNIVRADIDGRGTYYRVRIPASSREEAIQLCTRYKAAGGSCFVSR